MLEKSFCDRKCNQAWLEVGQCLSYDFLLQDKLTQTEKSGNKISSWLT